MERLIPKTDPEGLAKLLRSPKSLLTGLEAQQQFIARMQSTPCPCPMCFVPASIYDAGDDTLAVGESYEGAFVCPNCGTELARVVPFVMQPGSPGWHWMRKHPILNAEVERARAAVAALVDLERAVNEEEATAKRTGRARGTWAGVPVPSGSSGGVMGPLKPSEVSRVLQVLRDLAGSAQAEAERSRDDKAERQKH